MSEPPRIAIVDDDEAMRDALEALVQSLGYAAATFSSADAFLASPAAFDCILLDVQMPGMNGLDLQDRLVAAGSTVPVIFVTSYGDANVRRRARRGGAFCVLEKPVQDHVIIRCLGAALAGEAAPG